MKFSITLFTLLCIITFIGCQNTPETISIKSSFYTPMPNQQTLSSDNVTCFVMDKDNTMWIGTSFGLNKYNGRNYQQFFHNENDSLSIPGNQINTLFKDHKGQIWIGTENGLARYIGNGFFQTYKSENGTTLAIKQIIESSDKKILSLTSNGIFYVTQKNELIRYNLSATNAIQQTWELGVNICSDPKGGFWYISPKKLIYYDQNAQPVKEFKNQETANMAYMTQQGNNIWFTQSRRLKCLNLNTQQIVYTSPHNLDILPNVLMHDGKNLYLKSDKHGLFTYDTLHHTLNPVSQQEFTLQKNPIMISCIYQEPNRNLWIGYYNGGFQFISPSERMTDRINQQPLYTSTLGHQITALSTDSLGNVWCGTDNHIYIYQPSVSKIQIINQNEIFTDSPYYRQSLQKIITDTDQTAWLLTNVRVVKARFANQQLQTLFSVNPGPILDDCIIKQHRCYATINNRSHLLIINENGTIDSVSVSNPMYKNGGKLLDIDSNHILLVMQGLQCMLFNTQTYTMSQLTLQGHPENQEITPTALIKDNQRVWLATNGHGLFMLDIDQKRIVSIQTLPQQQIMSLVKDSQGTLWMGTRKGIVSYAPETKQSYLYRVHIGSNIPFQQFREQCICTNRDNILLGSNRGCITIHPSSLKSDELSHLKIKSIHIKNQDEDQVVMNIKTNKYLYFSHQQNDLDILYESVHYGNAPLYMHQYKLEGFDVRWNIAPLSQRISYANLPAGNYTFKIRSLQGPNTPPLEEKSISFTIMKAPWFSIPAIIGYVILIIALIVYINRLYLRIRSNQMALQLANADKERELRTNQMNMSFFANISHEFRNPLTIIAGPLMTLKSDKTLPPSVHRKINIVCQSVKRMLRLIDQMLDFNQLENDVLRLRVGQYDIIHELNQWVDIFEESTTSRRILLTRKRLEASSFVYIDHDKLDKILSNLFTNALKHTPEGGEIALSYREIQTHELPVSTLPGEHFMEITIFNSGSHIPDEKLQDVFKRYYQIKGTSQYHDLGWGTGIGLYYVQRLVLLHKGHIWVENTGNTGVTFHVILPTDSQVYTPEEHVTEKGQSNLIPQFALNQQENQGVHEIMEQENKLTQKPHLLIVDDDIQLANYLRSLFCEEYVVTNKYSAEEALKCLEETTPDLILSDVIMGEMSGYALCKTLKEDLMYSHIPVILITAKSTIDEQIEGLQSGANAYVPKPFDPTYLQALVRSQLQSVESIKKQLAKNTQVDTLEEKLSPQDRSFMDEVYKLMEKHLSDMDLNVASMCEDLCISRTKFNYKLKALTGDTPNNFFKKYKLNQAAKLLREGKNNVSEVAIITGFGTLSHFSVCFKKQFGVSPSEYR